MDSYNKKILLVEDNPGDARLVREMLKDIQGEPFILEHTEYLASALHIIKENSVDIILLDLSLPDSQGLKTFCTIQGHASRSPVIVLSGLDDKAIAIEAVKKGAQDYLIKGEIEGNVLARSIWYAIERKQNELVLQEGERRYRRLVEMLPDIVYRIDTNGRFTFINDAISVFGYKPKDLIGEHFSKLIHPDDIDKISRMEVLPKLKGKTNAEIKAPKLFDERRTGERKTTGLEVRIKPKQSQEYMEYIVQVIRWPRKQEKIVEVAATGHYDEDIKKRDKHFIGTIGVIRDITGHKQAEELICKLSLAVEQSPNMIIIADIKGQIEYANPKFTMVTNYIVEEIIGNSLMDILKPDETSGKNDNSRWDTIVSNSEWREEFLSKKKNKEPFWANLTISPIKNQEGAVSHYLAIMEDVTERKRTAEKVHYLAYYDSVTALPNRELFSDRLNMAIIHANRKKYMLAVIFIDLDRFKNINDTLGHSIGDRLLKVIASRLKNCLREEDTISRQGGDEFVLLLPEISRIEDIGDVIQRILKKIKEPALIKQHRLCITASAGIALYPNDGNTVETILKNADTAMYISKEAGKDNYRFYSPVMQERAYEQLVEETNLHHAVENREFLVYYQPQICIRTGNIIGMEALIRWNHHEKGVILPAEFIQLAEDTELIVPIDLWVLRTACRQNSRWQREGLPPVTVAVNISGHTFKRENFEKIVADIVKETNIPPDTLELEITERIAIQNLDETIIKLNELKRLGIKIAIDDFGTGFSSLGYLSKFPFEKLKIGMTFIHNLHKDPTNAAIVSSVTAMAKNLNLKVIAEGVEVKEQLNFLREIGCDEFQGFLFSKAVPEKKMREMLSNGYDS